VGATVGTAEEPANNSVGKTISTEGEEILSKKRLSRPAFEGFLKGLAAEKTLECLFLCLKGEYGTKKRRERKGLHWSMRGDCASYTKWKRKWLNEPEE